MTDLASVQFAFAPLVLAALGLFLAFSNPLMAGPLQVVTTEMEQYLVIGTGDEQAFVMSNTEIGADQEVVSSAVISDQQRVGGSGVGFSSGGSPDLQSQFFPGDVRNSPGESIFVPNQNTNGTTGTQQVNNRWNDIDPSAESNQDVVGTPDTLGIAGDGFGDARPLFEGIDWSGNVAITNQSGTVDASNSDVNADLGIQCTQTAAGCAPSLSDNRAYFDKNNNPDTAQVLQPGTGISGSVDFTGLLSELSVMKIAIAGQVGELTISDNIEDFSFKDGGTPTVVSNQSEMDALTGIADPRGPLIFDLDALDANNDGVVIIDVARGDNAFEINNSDVILLSESDTIAIFRVVDETNNYDFANSSIMMGEPDWDLATNPLGLNGDPITNLGAIFVIDAYNGENVVFNLDNVILGGIGLWDLIDLTGNGDQTTQIHMNNAQGCAQFISNFVNMQNNRWNRCAFSIEPARIEVPEPATLPVLFFGLIVVAYITKRRRAA